MHIKGFGGFLRREEPIRLRRMRSRLLRNFLARSQAAHMCNIRCLDKDTCVNIAEF